jgi:hypothetical protein
MRDRFSGSMITVAVVMAAVGAVISVCVTRTSAQAPAAFGTAPAPTTPWGEPDLQGIWTDESDAPLQRSPRFASQEFFTEAQRAELDKLRSALSSRDKRAERGTEADVAGAYNAVFTPMKRTGARTSRIVDPTNGRLPPVTAEAQKLAAAERAFRVALLQSTETCKNKEPACNGGKYDPAQSLRFAELPPRYNTARMNRHYGPEDATLAERCLTGGLPEFGGISFRRIVQTPGGIAMFYDVGQGQGWQRNIVMDGSPHLSNIRQWYGDSRGHWEGNTLVIDVTNFSSKTDFQGARENLHLIERWTRTGPTSLEYAVTVERAKVVLFVGIVGVAKVVEHRDGLDDAFDGLMAKRRDARRHDRHAAGQVLSQFVVERANTLSSRVHVDSPLGLGENRRHGSSGNIS